MPTKKNIANKNQKIFQLYGILMFRGTPRSLTQLAQALDCSKQTVLRYIEDLRLSTRGEIITWTGRDGQKYYKMEAPRPTNITLSPEDIQHLFMCHDLLTHLLPDGVMQEVADIIGHTTVLLKDFAEREQAFKSLFVSVPDAGRIDYTSKQAIFDTLKDAVARQRICSITYESMLQENPVPLSIAPLKLVSYKGGLYVRARRINWIDDGIAFPSYGRLSGQFVPRSQDTSCLLSVHRIVDIEPTPTKFEREQGDDKKDKQGAVFGLDLEPPLKVQAVFSPLLASYITKRTWSDDQVVEQLSDGRVFLEFTAGNRDEALSWILSFGDQVRLIAPTELVEAVHLVLGRTESLYRYGISCSGEPGCRYISLEKPKYPPKKLGGG
jgi:predicted DNA-binding transcriptional regulator YafY